jgi:FAD/FMN-containing dehydrogenase
MPGRLMLNFIDGFGKVGLERTKAAYPPTTFERLRDLKSRYDPANVFRFNHNIPPVEKKEE